MPSSGRFNGAVCISTALCPAPGPSSASKLIDLEINSGNYESIFGDSSPLYKRSTRPNACLCFHSSLLYEYTIYTSQLNSLMGISPPVSSWQIPPVSRQILCEYNSRKVHFYVHPIRRLVPRRLCDSQGWNGANQFVRLLLLSLAD